MAERTARSKPNKKLTSAQQESIQGYLFISFSLIGTIIFVVLPLILTIVMSVTDWDFQQGLRGFTWVGLAHYARLIKDRLVHISIKNNLFFSVVQILVTVILALILSILLDKVAYWKPFLRTIFFVPFITSWVSISIVFKSLFTPEGGIVNRLLTMLGVSNPPGWFMDVKWALPSIIIMTIWHTLGYYMVILLGGLQEISPELYEAAKIDGASAGQAYFRITLPLLTPSLFFILTMSMINSLKVFDQVSVATQGGPGTSTYVMVYTIYEYAFNRLEMGYAAAITWVLFLVILAFTLIQWKLQDRWVVYEN